MMPLFMLILTIFCALSSFFAFNSRMHGRDYLIILLIQAFVRVSKVNGAVKAPAMSQTSLMACRRNNKIEKRKRNREYARKHKSTTGGSRRKQVVEEKRLVVSKNEDAFQAEVFKVTTDDDMPAYSGFDFI